MTLEAKKVMTREEGAKIKNGRKIVLVAKSGFEI
jgi:hypothetical protein